MLLTVWRKIHIQVASQEVVALPFALELGSELLGRDPRHLGLPAWLLRGWLRNVPACVVLVFHVEIL